MKFINAGYDLPFLAKLIEEKKITDAELKTIIPDETNEKGDIVSFKGGYRGKIISAHNLKDFYNPKEDEEEEEEEEDEDEEEEDEDED
jgi:hypothetical protein